MTVAHELQLRVDKMKNSLRRLFGGTPEAPRPKMCPACGTLVGINATRCHFCGTSMNFSMAAAGRGVSGFFGGSAPATSVLLVVNILMFVVTLVSSLQRGEELSLIGGMNGEVLYRLGASVGQPYLGHQYFRLVTANFLHGSVLHIFFNMWVLLSLGPVLEELYGSARFLFLYIITGIAGYVLSASQGHFSVGASAALLGMIGALLAVTTKRGGDYIRSLRSRLIFWVVLTFAQGLGIQSLRVDNWAHFGGLAAGFVLGKLLADRQPLPGPEMKRAYALGWLAAAIILVSFAFMIFQAGKPLE
jgi:membrane associated rhomboid family serine protease